MIVGLSSRWAARLAGIGLMAVPTLALAEAKDPSGTYLTQDGRARIRVEKCLSDGESICGYVVWMKRSDDASAATIDKNNPSPAKARRALLGHQLILGLSLNSSERFEGEIYNNEDGKKYDVSIWLDRPNLLKVRGCLVAPLCSTQNWTRVSGGTAEGELVAATGTAGGPTPDAEYAGSATASKKPAPARKPKT